MKTHRIDLKEAKESIQFIVDEDTLFVYINNCQYITNLKNITFFKDYIYLRLPVTFRLAVCTMHYGESYPYMPYIQQIEKVDIWLFNSCTQVTVTLKRSDFYQLKYTLEQWKEKRKN